MKSEKPLNRNEKHWLVVFERIEELQRLYDESERDVAAMVQLLRIEPGSQFVRRTLVRNFAAHVEGFIYMLKQVTLALSHFSRASFTNRDLARLQDLTSYMDEEGKQQKLRFDGFLKNMKLAFKSYAKVRGSEFKLDCKDTRYAYFTEMIQVRHRLVHPKSFKTFAVSGDEIMRIGKARDWFVEQASYLLKNPRDSGQFKSKFMQIPGS